MNKRIIITEFGGPEVLELIEDAELPMPAAGEVRVKVLAAGTGFTDTIIRQGQYVDVKDKPPFTPGYDWYGVIDALGEGVDTLEIGQPVADMPVIGAYCQYLCVSAKQVVPAPEGLDPAEAVAMVLSYTTAYQMLTRVAKVKKGQSILVHAAGGAVGTAVLDLARAMELKVYGTASEAKHELVKSFEASPIDYRNEDFVEAIDRYTEGRGVDVVLDTIGGAYWSRSYQCLAKGGILVAFGALQLTNGQEKLPSLLLGFAKLMLLWRLLPDGKRSTFYNIQKDRLKHPQEFSEDLQSLFAMLAAGRIKPAIAGRRPLADALEVHQLIDSADIPGKIVLLPN
ncbi:MAG: medium chain dehydrogenase/reductase family protein [Pseudomonadales bacterium]